MNTTEKVSYREAAVGNTATYEDMANPPMTYRIIRTEGTQFVLRNEDTDTEIWSDLRQCGWDITATLPDLGWYVTVQNPGGRQIQGRLVSIDDGIYAVEWFARPGQPVVGHFTNLIAVH